MVPTVDPPFEAGTCIELFSGGGGLAMALHEAGFRHLLLNESNKRRSRWSALSAV